MSLQRTAAPRNCTSKRPRHWSALGAETLRKRLGSERSAPGSCMSKRSGSKTKRIGGQPVTTASRAATGRTFVDAALAPRDEPVNLSESRPETHQHWSPAGVNCCQSLLLDPDATISIDLHKRLFLLVPDEENSRQDFPYHGCALPTELGGKLPLYS